MHFTALPARPDVARAAVRRSGAAKVKVAVSDIDGILRGKYLHADKFFTAAQPHRPRMVPVIHRNPYPRPVQHLRQAVGERRLAGGVRTIDRDYQPAIGPQHRQFGGQPVQHTHRAPSQIATPAA